MKNFNKKKQKFPKCIDHSNNPLIPAHLIPEKKLNPPMGYVHWVMPKFDW